MDNKAIVVGSGIVGIATARVLAKKGYKVSVYERNHQATGASVRNFGMVWPIGQPSGRLYEIAFNSRRIWKEIADSGKLWYDPVGSLHLAYNKDEWQVLNELEEAFKKEGRNVQLLNPEQVASRSELANPRNCFGGLFSEEEMIIDPREALAFLPGYLQETLGIEFIWGKAVASVGPGFIRCGKEVIQSDLIFICSGSDFETLYPEEFEKLPLTKCKLQMMRFVEKETRRIGPAICGGLSLIHYKSFEAAPSLGNLKIIFKEKLPDFLQWGIHVMVSQNHVGQLTIGDSHQYSLSPDPFDRMSINDLILKYLGQFAVLKNPSMLETWNGTYGKFTNGQTELFCSPDPGVYILNGLGGNGMTMSFGLAEELVGKI